MQRYSHTVVGLNTWYHVAAVYNASTRALDIYVNGVLDDGVLSRHGPVGTGRAAGVDVNVGRRPAGYYFGGRVDELRIYSRALSAAEIQSDMNTPLPGANACCLRRLPTSAARP